MSRICKVPAAALRRLTRQMGHTGTQSGATVRPRKRTPTVPVVNTVKPRYGMWLPQSCGLPALCFPPGALADGAPWRLDATLGPQVPEDLFGVGVVGPPAAQVPGNLTGLAPGWRPAAVGGYMAGAVGRAGHRWPTTIVTSRPAGLGTSSGAGFAVRGGFALAGAGALDAHVGAQHRNDEDDPGQQQGDLDRVAEEEVDRLGQPGGRAIPSASYSNRSHNQPFIQYAATHAAAGAARVSHRPRLEACSRSAMLTTAPPCPSRPWQGGTQPVKRVLGQGVVDPPATPALVTRSASRSTFR